MGLRMLGIHSISWLVRNHSSSFFVLNLQYLVSNVTGRPSLRFLTFADGTEARTTCLMTILIEVMDSLSLLMPRSLLVFSSCSSQTAPLFGKTSGGNKSSRRISRYVKPPTTDAIAC